MRPKIVLHKTLLKFAIKRACAISPPPSTTCNAGVKAAGDPRIDDRRCASTERLNEEDGDRANGENRDDARRNAQMKPLEDGAILWILLIECGHRFAQLGDARRFACRFGPKMLTKILNLNLI